MKTFVAMPSLQDKELVPTIKEVLSKARYPQDIVFGIRFLTNHEDDLNFFSDLKKRYNIRGNAYLLNENNFKNYIGVGKARKEISEYYDNEKYILSIDSHTMLADEWDVKLRNYLSEAKLYTGNPKTILTMQGGSYRYTEEGKEIICRQKYVHIGYPTHWSYEQYPFLVRPLYDVLPPAFFNLLSNVFGKFIPIPKFSYHASFSDKMFLYDEDNKITAMEDDMLKTFKLLNDGWELIYPNVQEALICHLYKTDINEHGGMRQFSYHYQTEPERIKDQLREKSNALYYLEDPSLFHTLRRYEKWLDVDLSKPKFYHNNKILESLFNDI